MLAFVANPEPPFPYIGSAALYLGQPVTIHQRTDDGRALVFGPGIVSRVELSDLSPANGDGLFATWLATRVDPDATPFDRTDETDLFVDYACWLESAGHDPSLVGTRQAFAAGLAAAGYTSTTACRPALIRGRTVRVTVWQLRLIAEGDA